MLVYPIEVCSLIHWHDTSQPNKPIIAGGAAHSGDAIAAVHDAGPAYVLFLRLQIYKPSGFNTLRYHWLVFNDTSSSNVFMKMVIDPDDVALTIPDSVGISTLNTWYALTNTADISALSTGWYDVDLYLKNATGGETCYVGFIQAWTVPSVGTAPPPVPPIPSGLVDRLQVKEHLILGGAAAPDVVFSKYTSTTVLAFSSDASYSTQAYFFIVFPLATVQGKKIRFSWQGQTSTDSMEFRALLYDGWYDRSSATDFPTGSNDKATKGAGLLQTLASQNGNLPQTLVTETLTLGSATQDYVTVFWQVRDVWNAKWGKLYLFGNPEVGVTLALLNNDDSVFWETMLSGALTMEATGTQNDYGYVLL